MNTLLAWANLAKNSLQMWNRFSSFQLVLGQNPNLSNIMTDGLPALHGTTFRENFGKAFKCFAYSPESINKCEADERFTRPLCHQVRAVEDVFQSGELVYYVKDGSSKWLGPGKVIFQYGRLVFVQYGRVYVGVSTNRLIKCGKKFKRNGGGDGRQGGAMGIDDQNRGSLREVELKQKRVHSNGVFGVKNAVADDNIGCDVVNSGADTNEDFGVENEVVGENIGQYVVDSRV